MVFIIILFPSVHFVCLPFLFKQELVSRFINTFACSHYIYLDIVNNYLQEKEPNASGFSGFSDLVRVILPLLWQTFKASLRVDCLCTLSFHFLCLVFCCQSLLQ
eukprot:TRINITY_DN2315_c0_g1_i3.p4 TRINITY_DN2315_c0_g1~~TRINITY_DN2315_c0_g1_i3.p4  ORF type:complete len:104 (+),score=12.35 TRINITY_DN2315_c0_g1_i3:978-1289(+)